MPRALIEEGARLLKKNLCVEAQRLFYRAVEIDPNQRLAIAELWRKAGWGALWGFDDPENAWHAFHNARALYRKLGHSKLAEAERGLAIAASRMGEHQEAVEACDRATASADADELEKLAHVRGIALSMLDRDDEARKSVEGVKTPQARQTLGVLEIKRGRPREALPLLTDEVLRAWAHLEAGEYEKVLELDAEDRPRAYALRAEAWLALGKRARAMVELRKGMRLLEEGRAKMDTEDGRAAFTRSKAGIYSLLVRISAEEGKWEEAFDCAEGARARSFLDFLAEGRRLSPSERDKLKAARKDEAEYRMLLRRYEKEHLADAHVQPKEPLSASELRKGLEDGEAILEYFVDGGEIHAFLLTPRKFHGTKLAGEVLEEVDDFPTAVAVARRDGGGSFFEWQMERLRTALLGGLPLDGVKRLVVVPHGPLHAVPFPALAESEVILAPSANVYAAIRKRKAPGNGDCLFVHDPTETLSHAGDEEEALRERFGGKLSVLAGEAATQANVLKAAPGRGILHFSTHAVFRPERSEFSHLELSDGPLFASDVLELDLSGTGLAVLAACESGRGRSEEMIGLPRAFLRAGVRTVLATLWPVEDHPGIAVLMGEFYRAFPAGTAAGALRAAQSAAARAGVPATVWAAFAAFGG